MKRQKAEEAIRRKALAVQKSIDLSAQLSNAAVTVSECIRFLTSYASRSATLGSIAYFATIASILASIFAVRQQFKALTKLRRGGGIPLDSRTHEQQNGHRIEETNIYVERGEHVTSAKSSEKYDEALTALNQDDPKRAWESLARQFGFGLPDVIVKQIQTLGFSRPTPGASPVDLSLLTVEMKQQKELTRVLVQHMAAIPMSQMTGLGDGQVIEKDGNWTTITDHGKR